jgi:hypothetical protein
MDPIRQGLFGNRSLKEWMGQNKPEGLSGPFRTLVDAAEAADQGNTAGAKTLLRGILELPDLETRTHLWIWSALRELGEQPDPRTAGETLGVVVEVPMKNAYDTLAGYRDGTARYLNFSGAAIFWDTPDGIVRQLCRTLLASVAPEASRSAPRTNVSLPKSGVQATLLTRAGMFGISNPSQAIMKPAQDLMLELMRRAKARRG